MKLLGIAGSLRAASWHQRLLTEAAAMLPGGVTLERQPIDMLPHYNADLDGENPPAAVVALREAISAADALLFMTPEYNYSIPGVLKNAIDWASRPAYKSPLAGKPAGVITSSPGAIGGARAQAHLKLVLAGTLTPVYPAPELALSSVATLFDDEGRLADADTRKRLQRYLDGFVAWAGSRPA